MKHTKQITSKLVGTLSALAGAMLISTAVHAQIQTINFDSVDASGGAIDATSYLANDGVTLSAESPAGTVDIISDQNYYGNNFVVASSGTNFLLQSNNSQPNTFTLTFANALDSFGFTRIAYSSAGDGLLAGWSASAYDGATLVETVGEPSESEFGGKAAVQFTLSDAVITTPDITSVVFSANGFGSAGVSAAPVDDFVLTTPEPSSWALALLCVGFFGYIRTRVIRV
jgi:hypothetical protein